MRDRLNSFKYAFAGVWTLLKTQPNARTHLVATVIVLAMGWRFKITTSEWLWITIAIVSVWTAEAFNTAVEFLADALHPDQHPLIKQAKDVSAAAVLISAMGAAVIGFVVFLPRLI